MINEITDKFYFDLLLVSAYQAEKHTPGTLKAIKSFIAGGGDFISYRKIIMASCNRNDRIESLFISAWELIANYGITEINERELPDWRIDTKG